MTAQTRIKRRRGRAVVTRGAVLVEYVWVGNRQIGMVWPRPVEGYWRACGLDLEALDATFPTKDAAVAALEASS